VKEKCKQLESSNNVLANDIKLLQDKLIQDKKEFQTTLSMQKVEIENSLAQIDTLSNKVLALENLLYYSDTHRKSTSISPRLNNTGNLQAVTNTMRPSSYALTRELEPQSSDSSRNNVLYSHGLRNLNILADSHGRGLAKLLGMQCSSNIFGMVKPGAKAPQVLDSYLSQADVNIIMVGSNDVNCNESIKFLRSLKSFLVNNKHAVNIICNLPLRYDLPSWSAINNEIRKVNNQISTLQNEEIFENVIIIDVAGLGRRFHTRHGLHLNALGKKIVGDIIIAKLLLECKKPVSKKM
jgi:hypothetical protein